jgi:hypothetical protein
LIHCKELGRFDPTMAGYDSVVRINQDWVSEAERADAIGDLSNLMLGMSSCVLWMRRKFLNLLGFGFQIALYRLLHIRFS